MQHARYGTRLREALESRLLTSKCHLKSRSGVQGGLSAPELDEAVAAGEVLDQ